MDMIPRGEKGRLIGEHHGRSRFKDAFIDHIRDLHEEGKMLPSEIRKKYNIPKQTLSDILTYKTRAVTPTDWKARRGKKDGQ
jgi:hypothetical protein